MNRVYLTIVIVKKALAFTKASIMIKENSSVLREAYIKICLIIQTQTTPNTTP